MSEESKSRGWALLWLPPWLAFLGVVACGIPFVRPLVVVAIPFAAVAGAIGLGQFAWRRDFGQVALLRTALTIGLAGMAIYLALNDKHLIDWLEGN